MEAMAQRCEAMENFAAQFLDDVVEKIYTKHKRNPPVNYTLTASAQEVFFKFSKPQDHLSSSHGANLEVETCNNSKISMFHALH